MNPLTSDPRSEPRSDDDYRERTSRNTGFIPDDVQDRLREANVLIAGCGSIGGAAVEPLVRMGVRRFALADPGTYELNNLNRQNAGIEDLGRNKAEAAAERIRAVDPDSRTRVCDRGITAENVEELVGESDVIVDGVDVTTRQGLRAKYLLHESASRHRRPLFTGWDMAGMQYVRVYDYRKPSPPLDGKVKREEMEELAPWELLRRMVPMRFAPVEMLEFASRNLDAPEIVFPQLVYAADAFSALSARVTLLLLADQPVRKHLLVDVHHLARPRGERWRSAIRRYSTAARLLVRLRTMN
ncbi:HesA/MoeB/ThiF family protein [Glycomyces arizonensis]|uniref:HesA/MoeB/ThiF family protein n=1 Tax=Glycomyces arizonensis TaxID=256035 RepID=UPI000400DD19|nr:ThiF family adenylyltransferase [Glycomyces arizonensis]